MSQLNRREQELILDFYFHCGREDDISRGRDLIASNPEAAKLYARLEDTLSILDPIKYESCPDNLVDLTIARLKLAAAADQQKPSRLQKLLEQEQTNYHTAEDRIPSQEDNQTPVYKFHHRVGELLAAAAAIVLVLGILFPSAGFMRQHYYKVSCANNLRQIGQGFSTFANDNNDQMAASTLQAGSPWWKIGYQGSESHSNTRYPWQLVKGGYVKGNVFICRGNVGAESVQYDAAQISGLRDFPSRRNVTYSFILFCDKNTDIAQSSRKVIAGDLNPVFREIPDGKSIYAGLNEFEKILLDRHLKQILSPSHQGKGQNILNCDGSVEWIRVRVVNNDDIYTIEGIDEYTGTEMPNDFCDIFLVP